MATPDSTSNSGIYIIKNTKNGNFYLGQSHNLRQRWNAHRSNLRKGSHHNIHLQRAWNKYGEKSFKLLILEYCLVEQLNEREQHYLDLHATHENCYNIAIFVDNATRGRKLPPFSEEHRRKISVATRGKTRSSETRRKIAEANRGKVLSEETRRKVSKANRGKKRPPFSEEWRLHISEGLRNKPPVSEETRRKLSEAHRGEKHPNFGKPMSDEQKRKISDTKRGKPLTEEHRRKLSKAKIGNKIMLGKKLSEQTRQKISESLRGEKNPNFGELMSEEQRKKISDAGRNRPPMSEETRQKMADSHRGSKRSSETRQKMSESAKRYHANKRENEEKE